MWQKWACKTDIASVCSGMCRTLALKGRGVACRGRYYGMPLHRPGCLHQTSPRRRPLLLLLLRPQRGAPALPSLPPQVALPFASRCAQDQTFTSAA